MLLAGSHSALTGLLSQVTTPSQIHQHIFQVFLSDPSVQPQKERVWFLRRETASTSLSEPALWQEDAGKEKKERRRDSLIGDSFSFIDLIIVVKVILSVAVFLLLLNWIAKKGDS